MEALLSVLPLSLTSGINLYLTLLALGVSERLEWVDLPAGLDFVSSYPVMVVAAALFFFEFFADKIPYVDNVWDFVHTFIRPAGALVLALGLVPADDPDVRMAAMMLAGTTALTAHGSKATFRAMVNTSPEPVSNSVVSLTEDLGVLGLLALVAAFPLLAVAVSVVVLVALVFLIVFVFRWAKQAFGSVRAMFRQNQRPVRDGT